jgi:hypothetical protein
LYSDGFDESDFQSHYFFSVSRTVTFFTLLFVVAVELLQVISFCLMESLYAVSKMNVVLCGHYKTDSKQVLLFFFFFFFLWNCKPVFKSSGTHSEVGVRVP